MIQQPTNVSYPKISLPSTPSSSAECKEEEPHNIEEKGKKRRKVSTMRKKNSRKCEQDTEREIVPESCSETIAEAMDGIDEIDL